MSAGGVGGEPGVTLTRVPASVIVRVTPWLVTVSDVPNRKLAVVWPPGATLNVAMPPRMPIDADGVLILTSEVLLIAPPTKRKTPTGALSASSPVFFAGS